MTIRRMATIVARNVNAPGRPEVIRRFYEDEAYDRWAAPEYERRPIGSRVEIEIRSFDDQFAYPVR